jgi:hypothetical protein
MGLFTDIYDNILQDYNLLHNEDYLRHNLTRTTLRFSGKFTEHRSPYFVLLQENFVENRSPRNECHIIINFSILA